MSKTKADIIMANAVKYGLVNYRADTMEPVEPEDFTGLPICDDYVMDQNYSSELRQRIYEDMLKHFEADPKSMLNTQGTEIGVDMAVAGGDQTFYGREVHDHDINQALKPAPHPDPLLAFLDDAIKRRAYGEFIPLPLFEAVMEMVTSLPNTKLINRGYPDTYNIAAALEELRRLRPFNPEELDPE